MITVLVESDQGFVNRKKLQRARREAKAKCRESGDTEYMIQDADGAVFERMKTTSTENDSWSGITHNEVF